MNWFAAVTASGVVIAVALAAVWWRRRGAETREIDDFFERRRRHADLIKAFAIPLIAEQESIDADDFKWFVSFSSIACVPVLAAGLGFGQVVIRPDKCVGERSPWGWLAYGVDLEHSFIAIFAERAVLEPDVRSGETPEISVRFGGAS